MQNYRTPCPAKRITGQKPKKQRFRWDPARQPADARNKFERLNSLLKFEVAQVFLHHVGHRHAQSRREILRRHCILFVRIVQYAIQAVGESLSIPGRIEIYRQFFTLTHLPEIRKISTDDRHAKSARQMRYAAATGGRRIRHHRYTRSLE